MFFRISLAAAVATLSCVGFLAGADPAAGQTSVTNAEPKTIAELVAAVKREGGELDVSWSQAVYGGAGGAQRFQDAIDRKYDANLKINYTPLAMPGR